MWRTICFVSTIGESVFSADQALDLRGRHQRQHAGGPQAGVVDEPVDRPGLPADALDQRGNPRDLGEVERHEPQRPRRGPIGLLDRRCQLIVHLPRDGDGIVARRRSAGGRCRGRGRGCRRSRSLYGMTGQLAGGGDFERGDEADEAPEPCGAPARRGRSARISRGGSLGRGGGASSTTSAVTSAPVIGLCFGRTFDMRTAGWRLMAASTSSGWTLVRRR